MRRTRPGFSIATGLWSVPSTASSRNEPARSSLWPLGDYYGRIARNGLRLFAAEGANILAVACDTAKLDAAFSEYDGIATLSEDIGSPGAEDRVIAAADAKLGGTDIIANAAGLFEMAAMDSIDEAHWNRVFATNVVGPMMLCTKAIPALMRSRAGRIINIGSVSVRLPPHIRLPEIESGTYLIL